MNKEEYVRKGVQRLFSFFKIVNKDEDLGNWEEEREHTEHFLAEKWRLKWELDDAVGFLKQTEEINPRLSEKKALLRMRRISEKYDENLRERGRFCPCCRGVLRVTGQARLETTYEHVCDPNGTPCMKDKYECMDEDCATYKKCYWNEDGELYGSSRGIHFIGNNDSPFNSISRQTNVEVMKKDENYYLAKDDKMMIQVEYQYKSNKNGDILEKKPKLVIWKKGDIGFIFCHEMELTSETSLDTIKNSVTV